MTTENQPLQLGTDQPATTESEEAPPSNTEELPKPKEFERLMAADFRDRLASLLYEKEQRMRSARSSAKISRNEGHPWLGKVMSAYGDFEAKQIADFKNFTTEVCKDLDIMEKRDNGTTSA